MTRSTDSRRARNSASLTIGARRRPASRPSRRRCFLASSRVEPETAVISSSAVRPRRTRVTVFAGSSELPPPPSSPVRRRRRRRREVPSPASSSSVSPCSPSSSVSSDDVALGSRVGGLAAAAATAAAAAPRTRRRRHRRRESPSSGRRPRASSVGPARPGRRRPSWPSSWRPSWRSSSPACRPRAPRPRAARPRAAGPPSSWRSSWPPSSSASRSGRGPGRARPARCAAALVGAGSRRPSVARGLLRPAAFLAAAFLAVAFLAAVFFAAAFLAVVFFAARLLGAAFFAGASSVDGVDSERGFRSRWWSRPRACTAPRPGCLGSRVVIAAARSPGAASSLRGGDTLAVSSPSPADRLPRSPALSSGRCHRPAGPRRGLASTSLRFPENVVGSASVVDRHVVDLGEYRTAAHLRQLISGPQRVADLAGRPGPAVPGPAGSAGVRRPGRGRGTAVSPVSTSSGRTAGSRWRSTRSSRLPSSVGTATSETTAARLSKSRIPFLVIRCTSTSSGREERRHRGLRLRDRDRAGRSASGWPRSRSVSPRAGRLDHLDHVQPVGQRLVERGVHRGRVDDLGQGELEVLRLAGRAGRRGAGVRDARVRVEAGRVGHRQPGPEHRPLEGPAEVAVAGEPEPAALGVADPQPLHRRRRLLGLLSGHVGTSHGARRPHRGGRVDGADPDRRPARR